MQVNQSITEEVRRLALSLPTISAHPELGETIQSWLDEQLPVWLPPLETCLVEIRAEGKTPGLAEFLAAWFLLNYSAGPLDNYADRDKEMRFWSQLAPQRGVLLAARLVVETLSLIPPDRSQSLHVLLSAVDDALAGQELDLRGVANLEQYEQMIRLKSGAIFRALFEGVAVLASAPENTQNALSSFGEAVGVIIQVGNDVEGFGFEEAEDWRSDINGLHPTLPVLFALKALEGSPEQREVLQALLTLPPGERNVEGIREIVASVPTQAFLKGMLLSWEGTARVSLAGLGEPARLSLLSWLRGLTALRRLS